MNDYTESNLELAGTRSHVVKVTAETDAGRAELLPSQEEDKPTLVVHIGDKDLFIHSRFDPVREARRWAESRKIKSKRGYVFVFGFGLGYHIEALLEVHPEIKKIFVVEVSPDVFRAALAARDLSPMLTGRRVHIFAGSYPELRDYISGFLSKLTDMAGDESSDVLIHNPSIEAFPDDAAELREILEYIRLASSEREVFPQERKENTEANKEAFDAAPGVNSFFGSCAGRPLIVAASGPSLDTSLESLKAASCLPDIVAVDSALAPFHRAGLRPRFVVTGDPQKKTMDLFEGLDITDENLIFFPSSNPDVVAFFPPSQRYAAYSSVSDDERRLDSMRNKGLLNFSGTVFMASVDFAVRTGADPIVLIGADFSFLDDRTHATGSRTQGYIPRYGRMREIIGLDGKTVGSSDVLYLYLKDFEKYHTLLGGSPLFMNATARGAAILNVPHIILKHFLDEYERRSGGRK